MPTCEPPRYHPDVHSRSDAADSAVVQRLRDEQQIRDLGYLFADACNRGDVAAFRELWVHNAVWIIGAPVDVRCAGQDEIATTMADLGSSWDFFVQMPHAPVITIDGDQATGSWVVAEHANDVAGDRGYFNYARYEDRLIRTPDGWRYQCREYRYTYLDQTPATGSAIRGKGLAD